MGEEVGKLFSGGMTNTALSDPNTGKTQWFGPEDNANALKSWAQGQRNYQPSLTSTQPEGNSPLGPDLSTPAPVAQKPSFAQASEMGATPGGMNAASPGLTKAGKLATLLTSGLQGALAGRANSEQAVLASGGRRGGGVGAGFEAGYQLPWQRAAAQADVAQRQAQTELTKSQGTMVNTPNGPVPAWLARYISPAEIRAGSAQQVAQTGAQSRQNVAGIGAGARTGAAQIGADARVKAAELNMGPLADVPQDLQEQFGLPPQLPLRMLNQAEGAANRPLTLASGENGPSVVNKQTGATRNLGLGSPVSARPVQAAPDPNNPGAVQYMKAGDAIRSGAASPQSAPVVTARATAKSIAPGGKTGDQINAFNTAMVHADLLKQVAMALKNGNSRTIAGLKNKLEAEFGSSKLNDFNTVANVYNNEINKMVGGGGATINDLQTSGATLPSNANLDTLISAIDKYHQLAASKLQQTHRQVQKGMQGKADFPNSGAATGGPTHIWTPQGLQPTQ